MSVQNSEQQLISLIIIVREDSRNRLIYGVNWLSAYIECTNYELSKVNVSGNS